MKFTGSLNPRCARPASPHAGQARDRHIAAALRRGVAEQRRQQHGALQIKPDVVLVGEADRAVKLDAGLSMTNSASSEALSFCSYHRGIDAQASLLAAT